MLEHLVHDIECAQDEQDADGEKHPGEHKYVVLPALTRMQKLWLRLSLTRKLYSQIEWTDKGAVFHARKS